MKINCVIGKYPHVLVIGLGNVFFFSSRGWHTRSLCDWSSDVCSSDLVRPPGRAVGRAGGGRGQRATPPARHVNDLEGEPAPDRQTLWPTGDEHDAVASMGESGRMAVVVGRGEGDALPSGPVHENLAAQGGIGGIDVHDG